MIAIDWPHICDTITVKLEAQCTQIYYIVAICTSTIKLQYSDRCEGECV